MIYKIIAVKDTKLGCFMPAQCVNDTPVEDIVESHRRAVLMKKIPVNMALHYQLFLLGKYDDKSGIIEPLEKAQHLVDLADFIPAPIKEKLLKEESLEVEDDVLEG